MHKGCVCAFFIVRYSFLKIPDTINFFNAVASNYRIRYIYLKAVDLSKGRQCDVFIESTIKTFMFISPAPTAQRDYCGLLLRMLKVIEKLARQQFHGH